MLVDNRDSLVITAVRQTMTQHPEVAGRLAALLGLTPDESEEAASTT